MHVEKLFIFFCFFLASCATGIRTPKVTYHFVRRGNIPDYTNLDYWAAHPWKKNPSDSISFPLLEEKRDTAADVFFIYPTTYTGLKSGWNADINDASINSKTDYTTILYQASVFNQHCRVFSPRYRQAHIAAFFVNNDTTAAAFDTAYADIKRAFEYYMQFYNKGRPLIIAGHSQGAKMSERLLKEFFDDKPLQKILVAAYVIGWAIPKDYFSSLAVCTSPGQTGCFCGWRTFRKGYIPDYILHERPESFVTNPLSWDTSGQEVQRAENLGSLLKNFNQIIPNTTDAQIHNGVLWIERPRFPGSILFRLKNYHIADINLFYMNLRKNIAERILAFKAEKK